MNRKCIKALPSVFACALALAAAPSLHAQGTKTCAAEIGITAEACVIASIDLNTAGLVLDRIDGAMEFQDALAAEHAEETDAAAYVSFLADELLIDPVNDELAAEHQAAVAALDVIKQNISGLREALFAVAVEGIPATTVDQLKVWREGAAYRVPPEFRINHRTKDEWKALVRALRAEARAFRNDDEELADDHASLLADVRANIDVIGAAFQLETNLPPMKELLLTYVDA